MPAVPGELEGLPSERLTDETLLKQSRLSCHPSTPWHSWLCQSMASRPYGIDLHMLCCAVNSQELSDGLPLPLPLASRPRLHGYKSEGPTQKVPSAHFLTTACYRDPHPFSTGFDTVRWVQLQNSCPKRAATGGKVFYKMAAAA